MKANATERSAKTDKRIPGKVLYAEEVTTESGTIKLAIHVLLEVVQSDQKKTLESL